MVIDGDTEALDSIENVATINIEGGDFFGTGSYGMPEICKILIKADWTSNN